MKFAGFCAAVLLSGCATLAPSAHGAEVKLQWDPAGPSNPVATDQLWHDGYTAMLAPLFPDDMPKLSATIAMQPAPAPAGVRKLADFHFEPAGATTLWFAQYSSSAKKAYCWWQVPLTWVTLGLWQVLVPTAWPCVAKPVLPVEEGYGYLRAAAAAAGANLIVISKQSRSDNKLVIAEGSFYLRSEGTGP